ncbi:hypothetical protein PI125_g12008 [Phytophthora idaei]|nr:hypothetical protein PI125_g12008 [Phytophthora idaei]
MQKLAKAKGDKLEWRDSKAGLAIARVVVHVVKAQSLGHLAKRSAKLTRLSHFTRQHLVRLSKIMRFSAFVSLDVSDQVWYRDLGGPRHS